MIRRTFLRTLGSVAVATRLASPLAAFAGEPDKSVSHWIADHSVALE
jgi:hypothetical protein